MRSFCVYFMVYVESSLPTLSKCRLPSLFEVFGGCGMVQTKTKQKYIWQYPHCFQPPTISPMIENEFQSNRSFPFSSSILQRFYTSYYPFAHNPLSPMSKSKIYSIWCFIDGELKPFSVLASVDDNIDNLLRAIRLEKPTLREFLASDLVLWNVRIFERQTYHQANSVLISLSILSSLDLCRILPCTSSPQFPILP